MLGTNTYTQNRLVNRIRIANKKYTSILAANQFDRMYSKGIWERFKNRIIRRSNKLLSFGEAEDRDLAYNRYAAGIRTVSIDQIRGSESRTKDFDAQFNPLHKITRYRWQRVMMAHLDGISLPPVELIQRGDNYFVRDGHHRISVARAMGQQAIEAEVMIYQ